MNSSILNNRISKFLPTNRIEKFERSTDRAGVEETLRDLAFVLQMTRRVRMEMESELDSIRDR